MPRGLDRLHLSEQLNRVQDRVEGSVRRLEGSMLLDGILLEDVELTASFQDFSHKLGRKYRGYIVVKASDDINLPNVEASADDTRFIRIASNATSTVSIWVF